MHCVGYFYIMDIIQCMLSEDGSEQVLCCMVGETHTVSCCKMTETLFKWATYKYRCTTSNLF